MPTTRMQRIERRRKLIKIFLLSIVAAILIFIGSVFFKFLGFYNKIHTKAQTTTKENKEQTEYTFLLLGYGGGNHDGAYLTDTLMVANVDIKTKKIVLISLPRDIWVKVPTKNDPFHSKINSVYQMGLFPKNYPDVDSRLLTEENPSGLIKKVIQDITGLTVDAFVAVDFEGFVEAIDTLDGVDVNVEKAFTDFEYPIEGKEDDLCAKEEQFKQIEKYLSPGFDEEEKKKLFEEKPELKTFFEDISDNPPAAFPCRYETLKFSKGDIHMDGNIALKYARSRHAAEDGGDFNRAKRQQQVIEAAREKVLRIDFIPKIIPLLDQLEEHIITDFDLGDNNKLLLEARKAAEYKVTPFVISDEYLTYDISDNGQFIVVPTVGIDNWSQIRRKIQEVRLGISPTPTKVPVTITPKVTN